MVGQKEGCCHCPVYMAQAKEEKRCLKETPQLSCPTLRKTCSCAWEVALGSRYKRMSTQPAVMVSAMSLPLTSGVTSGQSPQWWLSLSLSVSHKDGTRQWLLSFLPALGPGMSGNLIVLAGLTSVILGPSAK